jgi:GAF domain-containing protein
MAPREDSELPVPRGQEPEPRLSFPDGPRLELDQLLAQLVDRAQEVMGTQGRLRGLLRANQLVARELSSSAVLQRTTDAARELVGARRATLELAGPGGGRVESGEAGPRRRATDAGPRSPEPTPAHSGSGTARRPRPAVRLAPVELGELHVPIRLRHELVGTLHLEESMHAAFTAEDRELVEALAATAGLAIQNARLYESARRRGEWLQASAAITRQLLADAEGDARPLALVARSVRDVAGADVVAVLRPDPEGPSAIQLCVDVLVGPEGAERTGPPVPVTGTVLGRVFSEGGRVCLVDGSVDEALGAVPWSGLQVGAVLAVPLTGSATVHGVLCAARLPHRPAFSDTDVEMAGGLASQAAVALELADARAERQRAVVLDERERIAVDLHDTVVQRLFSVGLSLQGVLGGLTDGRAAERVRATVAEVDRTINQIRSTVFPLQAAAADTDPRDRLLDAVADVAPALGFEPDLRFSGLLAGTVGTDLVEDLVAVVRAGLLDVAARGRATSASVDVVEDRDGLVVHVRDDDRAGTGAATDAAEADLRRRAERHGGTFTVNAGTPAGTSLYWWVPGP